MSYFSNTSLRLREWRRKLSMYNDPYDDYDDPDHLDSTDVSSQDDHLDLDSNPETAPVDPILLHHDNHPQHQHQQPSESTHPTTPSSRQSRGRGRGTASKITTTTNNNHNSGGSEPGLQRRDGGGGGGGGNRGRGRGGRGGSGSGSGGGGERAVQSSHVQQTSSNAAAVDATVDTTSDEIQATAEPASPPAHRGRGQTTAVRGRGRGARKGASRGVQAEAGGNASAGTGTVAKAAAKGTKGTVKDEKTATTTTAPITRAKDQAHPGGIVVTKGSAATAEKIKGEPDVVPGAEEASPSTISGHEQAAPWTDLRTGLSPNKPIPPKKRGRPSNLIPHYGTLGPDSNNNSSSSSSNSSNSSIVHSAIPRIESAKATDLAPTPDSSSKHGRPNNAPGSECRKRSSDNEEAMPSEEDEGKIEEAQEEYKDEDEEDRKQDGEEGGEDEKTSIPSSTKTRAPIRASTTNPTKAAKPKTSKTLSHGRPTKRVRVKQESVDDSTARAATSNHDAEAMGRSSLQQMSQPQPRRVYINDKTKEPRAERLNRKILHMPAKLDKRRSCHLCSFVGKKDENGDKKQILTQWRCKGCDAHLCLTGERNCFATFHEISDLTPLREH